METIIAAAICAKNNVYGDDLIISSPQPARHYHLLHGMNEYVSAARGWEQGFLTSEGRFVNREDAFVLARWAGQIVEKHGPADLLFSEDMW